MSKDRPSVFIINRSFWPVYPVIGEALMRLAEQLASRVTVGVVLQDHADIRSHLAGSGRGVGVDFYPCKAWSVSGSSIPRRILDAVWFMGCVFLLLLRKRPDCVYISTDPPVILPFVVMLYCRLFRARYIYHLQDIHPEATNVVVKVNPLAFRLFRSMDGVTLRHADRLITITDEMAEALKQRSGTQTDILSLPNPSVPFEAVVQGGERKNGFVFCGNAGRLQRIPLLMDAIALYYERGGKLPFVFAGAGIYANALTQLASKYPGVRYCGFISSTQAAQLSIDYTWSLLPIEDEVTRYAFPSKTSSYVHANAMIAAICGSETSVAQWVGNHRLGVVIAPTVEAVCRFFSDVESGRFDPAGFDMDRKALKVSLEPEVFVERLRGLVVEVLDGT